MTDSTGNTHHVEKDGPELLRVLQRAIVELQGKVKLMLNQAFCRSISQFPNNFSVLNFLFIEFVAERSMR